MSDHYSEVAEYHESLKSLKESISKSIGMTESLDNIDFGRYNRDKELKVKKLLESAQKELSKI